MHYWRMQLHPDDPPNAMRHTFECLAAGYVGLDFQRDPGDLLKIERTAITPSTQQHYHDLALKMADGDLVLVVVRNAPFALVTVRGEYNYTTAPSTVGVWFRHFRAIARDSIAFDADRPGDLRTTDHAPMVNALQVVNPGTLAFDQIETWRKELASAGRVPELTRTIAS
jgi:hypothetical protein